MRWTRSSKFPFFSSISFYFLFIFYFLLYIFLISYFLLCFFYNLVWSVFFFLVFGFWFWNFSAGRKCEREGSVGGIKIFLFFMLQYVNLCGKGSKKERGHVSSSSSSVYFFRFVSLGFCIKLWFSLFL
ncbi:hypothetical protein L873DRAFT_884279 [Choiromyces venosus 120613-1]|uniref:Uncharacterized protein n=1 Tax=Choiromyces venosus 120613-1 TaxID=1336337 RepID=A0A3N4JRA5_9PEZI|nr:hypothetical protein L873DRAFT_884279 [Choiromyces venosus 120613-1]